MIDLLPKDIVLIPFETLVWLCDVLERFNTKESSYCERGYNILKGDIQRRCLSQLQGLSELLTALLLVGYFLLIPVWICLIICLIYGLVISFAIVYIAGCTLDVGCFCCMGI